MSHFRWNIQLWGWPQFCLFLGKKYGYFGFKWTRFCPFVKLCETEHICVIFLTNFFMIWKQCLWWYNVIKIFKCHCIPIVNCKTTKVNLKSDNLQYNTLVRWVAGTNDSLTKCLMFQVLFFCNNFLQNSLQKWFQFIFLFFHIDLQK